MIFYLTFKIFSSNFWNINNKKYFPETLCVDANDLKQFSEQKCF